MPIWLRQVTFNYINEYYKDQNKKIKESQTGKKDQTTLISPDGKVNTPEFLKSSQDYKGKTSYK